MSKVASAAAETVGSADEGAVVLVPVALVIGVAVALATVLGFAVFGLFGVEVLIGVAVEIAFASAGGALALKTQREGWLGHAVRRTIGPMPVALAITVLTGLAIGHWRQSRRRCGRHWAAVLNAASRYTRRTLVIGLLLTFVLRERATAQDWLRPVIIGRRVATAAET